MRIENLNVKYGDKVVFSNFNLDVLDGEITCVLGSSGVGKTTLLKHIASVSKSQNKKVAFVFQEPRLIEHLTVFENLKLIGYSENLIKNALEKLGLKDKIYSYPNHLSGGEKQRVNFARAILFDSDILLLDEPFSSVDVKLKVSLIKLLLEEKKNKTIVFVTHDIDEALMFSNRVILLKNNEISVDLTIETSVNEREYGKSNREREILLNSELY